MRSMVEGHPPLFRTSMGSGTTERGGRASGADPNTPVTLNAFQHPCRGPALVHTKTRRGQRTNLPSRLREGPGVGMPTFAYPRL
jgi:hypothetical protein